MDNLITKTSLTEHPSIVNMKYMYLCFLRKNLSNDTNLNVVFFKIQAHRNYFFLNLDKNPCLASCYDVIVHGLTTEVFFLFKSYLQLLGMCLDRPFLPASTAWRGLSETYHICHLHRPEHVLMLGERKV